MILLYTSGTYPVIPLALYQPLASLDAAMIDTFRRGGGSSVDVAVDDDGEEDDDDDESALYR